MASKLPIAIALCALLLGCSTTGNETFKGTALPVSIAPNFTLTDDSGSQWTLADQRGKIVALFFGYTHCPDTCPLTLAKLTEAVRRQGPAASNFEIAFVTVDPARDTPAALHRYVAKFPAAHIVGLTGSPDRIAAVERAYRVWAQKIPGTHHGGSSYDDAHSSVTYIIDREGRSRVLHDDSDDVASFAADFRVLAQ